MTIGNWTVRRGDVSWLAYEWRAADGRRVASYPTPRRTIYVLLYPWMVYKSIKAIREIAKAAGMR